MSPAREAARAARLAEELRIRTEKAAVKAQRQADQAAWKASIPKRKPGRPKGRWIDRMMARNDESGDGPGPPETAA